MFVSFQKIIAFVINFIEKNVSFPVFRIYDTRLILFFKKSITSTDYYYFRVRWITKLDVLPT